MYSNSTSLTSLSSLHHYHPQPNTSKWKIYSCLPWLCWSKIQIIIIDKKTFKKMLCWILLLVLTSTQNLTQLQQQIETLSNLQKMQKLSRSINEYQEIETSKLKFHRHCSIEQQPKNIHFVVWRKRIYTFINTQNRVVIYDGCEKLNLKIPVTSIKSIICDRGVCDGSLLLIDGENRIVQCGMGEEGIEGLDECVEIGPRRQNVMGACLRVINTNHKELIIQYKHSIEVLNKEGISIKSQNISEPSTSILDIVDHHPYPLLLSSYGWISYYDLSQNKILPTKCPWVQGATKLFKENPYGAIVYAVGEHQIWMIDIKGSDRSCDLLSVHWEKEPLKVGKVQGYRDVLFFGDRVVNPLTHSSSVFTSCSNPDFYFPPTLPPTLLDSEPSKALLHCCSEYDCSIQVIERDVEKQIQTKTMISCIVLTLLVCFGGVVWWGRRVLKRNTEPQWEYVERNRDGKKSKKKEKKK